MFVVSQGRGPGGTPILDHAGFAGGQGILFRLKSWNRVL